MGSRRRLSLLLPLVLPATAVVALPNALPPQGPPVASASTLVKFAGGRGKRVLGAFRLSAGADVRSRVLRGFGRTVRRVLVSRRL